MKKFFSSMIVLFFVLVSTGICCFAAVGDVIPQQKNEIAERFSLGAEVAYYGFGDKHDESEVQGAPMVKIVGEYALTENIVVNAKIGYTSTDVKDTDEGMKVLDLDIIPLEMNLKLQVPLLNEQVLPYVGGGFSYNIVDADAHNEIKSAIAPASMSVDADNCWGGQLFVGIDYRPINCISLYAEGGYSWAQSDIHYEINARPYYYESGTAEISLDSGFLGAGVKYLF